MEDDKASLPSHSIIETTIDRIKKYNPKHGDRNRKIFEGITGNIFCSAILQLVSINPCSIYFLYDAMTGINPYLNEPITQEILIDNIQQTENVNVALFAQLLMANSVLTIDDFSGCEWIQEIEFFSKCKVHISTSKTTSAIAQHKTNAETRAATPERLNKVAKCTKLPETKEKETLPSHLKLNVLPNDVQENMKSNLTDAMQKRLKGKHDANDKYLLKLLSSTIGIIDSHLLGILKDVLPLYTETSCRCFTAPIKLEIANGIKNIDEIATILNIYFPNRTAVSPVIYATLAGDAAQVYDDETQKNLYCFELLPLQADLPVVPIHFKLLEKGSAPSDLMDWFLQIIDKLHSFNIRVIFIATDGESTMTKEHNKFFFENIFPKLTTSFIDIVNSFGITQVMPLSDLLHLLKNARSHLINHLLFVDASHNICINLKAMEEALGKPKCLSDKSRESKMKDGYVIELFSWEYFINLTKEGRYEAAFFTLPFSALLESMRSTCLSNEDRLKFIELAFKIFVYHYNQIISNTNKTITENFSSKTSIGTLIGNKQWVIRWMNTCVGLARAITLHIDGLLPNLHLGRLGSHDVEYFFGTLRRISMNNETKEMAIHNIVKTILIKGCVAELTAKMPIKTRLNAAGIVLDAEMDQNQSILFPIESIHNVAYNLMIGRIFPPEVLCNYAVQLNIYSQKVLMDKKYPSRPVVHIHSGNACTRRLLLPYNTSVIPLRHGASPNLECDPGQNEHISIDASDIGEVNEKLDEAQTNCIPVEAHLESADVAVTINTEIIQHSKSPKEMEQEKVIGEAEVVINSIKLPGGTELNKKYANDPKQDEIFERLIMLDRINRRTRGHQLITIPPNEIRDKTLLDSVSSQMPRNSSLYEELVSKVGWSENCNTLKAELDVLQNTKQKEPYLFKQCLFEDQFQLPSFSHLPDIPYSTSEYENSAYPYDNDDMEVDAFFADDWSLGRQNALLDIPLFANE